LLVALKRIEAQAWVPEPREEREDEEKDEEEESEAESSG
jgi:hypothetical protein